jgi:hypothetical protein
MSSSGLEAQAAKPTQPGSTGISPTLFSSPADQASATGLGFFGKPLDAPEGIFDQAQLRDHRLVVTIVSGAGIAGGLGLAALGIYDLTRVYQNGFADKDVQGSILEMAGGVAVSSLFSFCMNIAIDPSQ